MAAHSPLIDRPGTSEEFVLDTGSPPRGVSRAGAQAFPCASSLSIPSRIDNRAMGMVDRVDELAAIRALLLTDEVRLLTLTGPGGVGKTRLALEAGRDLAQHFVDGVVFVDLSAVRNPDRVVEALIRKLGASDGPADESVPERLVAALRDRPLLIILDNAEQVLSGACGLAELLVAAPHVTLLVTSREALHLRWEYILPIRPLALPAPQHLPPHATLAEIPSVALFLQRARTINPDFVLTEDNARAVAELVVRLDGLPLAIELAAARTTLLSPQMLLERLDQRLSLLRWQAHDLPQRQQTLRGAIAWSYDLLSPEEQTFFRHLGIFAGSFSLRAAEAIAEHLGMDALESLASLVDKSMVQVYGRDQDNVRYVLLQSMRAYARERLAEAAELQEVGRIHALYYLALAEQAETELTGPDRHIWFARLEWAHENLRAALRWLLDYDEGDLALRLATALGPFWNAQGYWVEGTRQLEETLALPSSNSETLRARCLSSLGDLLILTAGESEGAGRSTAVQRAQEVLGEALELAGSIEDTLTVARSLTSLGVLGLYTLEWGQARNWLEKARTSWQEIHNQRGVSYTLLHLAAIETMEGNHGDAARLAEECLCRYRCMGDDSERASALLVLLSATGELGEAARAATLFKELLALSNQAQHPEITALCAAGVAWLSLDRGDPESLACLVGVAESRHRGTEHTGRALCHMYAAAARETLRTRMGQETFAAALTKGRSLPLDQMSGLVYQTLETALQLAGSSECAAKHAQPTILSPREQKVLQLVAQGLSNKRIAREIIVADSTVASHLTSIYNKLGVDTRAHAVAVAVQRGLVLSGQGTERAGTRNA